MEYCLNIQFANANKTYYFKTDDETIKENDYVVVESIVGIEIGKVVGEIKPLEEINFHLQIKPILRKATRFDITQKRENDKAAKKAMTIFNESIKSLNLDMNLLNAEYTLDKTKILFTYLASERVDFRELLKVLANKLGCRIELKQISPREKAQKIGGIGICGLELCCTKFINVFEGITLSKAKNQMLSINLPKLSGQCGKLMCCLKYEDDLYTEEKKNFPQIGTIITYDKKEYKVTGINIISKTIKIENEENIDFLTLEEFNKLNNKKKK